MGILLRDEDEAALAHETDEDEGDAHGRPWTASNIISLSLDSVSNHQYLTGLSEVEYTGMDQTKPTDRAMHRRRQTKLVKTIWKWYRCDRRGQGMKAITSQQTVAVRSKYFGQLTRPSSMD